MAKQKQMNKM